jgi:protein-S-isoprenylcysteine O-methyltransferase Ste14
MIRRLLRLIDLPPLWLIAFGGFGWWLDGIVPLSFPWGLSDLGPVLLGAGATLFGLGGVQMLLSRTTVIPRRDPRALVTGGVFRLTRNPIYLGDAALLSGAILWWDAPAALPLVPAFVWIITRRFIRDEEARLRAAFGTAFDDWATRVRRWL